MSPVDISERGRLADRQPAHVLPDVLRRVRANSRSIASRPCGSASSPRSGSGSTVRGRSEPHSSTASRAVIVYRSGPVTGNCTPPRCRSAVSDLQPVGDLAHAVVEDGVAGDPEHAVLLAVPAQREADHVADDRVAQRRAVAARRGGDLDRRPAGRLEPRASPTARARARRRRAARRPATVVTTTPADGSSARPAGSRLSPWWSWLSSTASIGPRSAAAIAGPASLRDAVPQPKL